MESEATGQVLHNLQDLNYEDLGVGRKAWSEKASDATVAAWEATKATYDEVTAKACASARATDRYVRARPYESIGIALGIGLLLGLLINRD
ncbi:MAG: hypothetical protein JWM04_1644 [Verrucomicrobiales bacterium]|nr:hypothetical protein [Verrucomicrobiales bacterium]